MHFRRSLPKKTAVERTRKPEKLSRRQAAKLIYNKQFRQMYNAAGTGKGISTSRHPDQNRNVFFRFIIFDFVGIKRILILRDEAHD